MLDMQFSPYYAQNLAQIAKHIEEHGFCVVDHFLAETTVSELANETLSLKEAAIMHEAGIGREHLTINKNIRGDSIYWLSNTAETGAQKIYFEQMEKLRLCLNEYFYLGLFALESHLAIYPVGAVYRKHLDCFATSNPQQPQRKITCIVYLNQDWHDEDGGQLRLYLNEPDKMTGASSLDISPIGGRAVIFLSDTFLHEVLPATKPRKSITGWFLTRPQPMI